MAKKHDGTANLIPASKRSKEEAKELGRKGGVQSGVTRRKQRAMKDILNFIDNQPVNDEIALTMKDFNIASPTFRDAIFAVLYQKMLTGDIRAIELYLRLKGEMPKDIELKAGDKSMTIIWNEKRYGTDEETE